VKVQDSCARRRGPIDDLGHPVFAQGAAKVVLLGFDAQRGGNRPSAQPPDVVVGVETNHRGPAQDGMRGYQHPGQPARQPHEDRQRQKGHRRNQEARRSVQIVGRAGDHRRTHQYAARGPPQGDQRERSQ